MANLEPLLVTQLPLPGRRQGKVRDVYALPASSGPECVLLVATDRISAFDVVMPTPVPGKGVALTQIATFWFDLVQRKLGEWLIHHLIHTDSSKLTMLTPADRERLRGRIMVARPARVVPIECVVRGYLAGSGWKEYRATQSVCGVKLPAGLKQADRLPQPIFTPATKAETGHDENISYEQACEIVGEPVMSKLREWSLQVYQLGHDHAKQCGIILADTKFEFGLDASGRIMLVDEIMTPDSSRFWPADQYEPGREQASYDKQFVRDYLEKLCAQGKWDKTNPGPQLPPSIVEATLDRYREACRKLTRQEPQF